MCAILDANTVREVFGLKLPSAGQKFRDWIMAGRGQLVIGGKLRKELQKSSKRFSTWEGRAIQLGMIKSIPDHKVESKTNELKNKNKCRSDDHHIIALAQVSGARLLYSNDHDLREDFKNKQLVDNPRGKVYSTLRSKKYSDAHKRLLDNRNLCRTY